MPGLLLINNFFGLTSERTLFVGTQKLLLATFLFLLQAIAGAMADALLWRREPKPMNLIALLIGGIWAGVVAATWR